MLAGVAASALLAMDPSVVYAQSQPAPVAEPATAPAPVAATLPDRAPSKAVRGRWTISGGAGIFLDRAKSASGIISSLHGASGDVAASYTPALSAWSFGIHAQFGHSRTKRAEHSSTETATKSRAHACSTTTPTTPTGLGSPPASPGLRPAIACNTHGTQNIKRREKQARNSSHFILDFEVGKDLGLGTTPWDEPKLKAVAGVRYARLTDNLEIDNTTATTTAWTSTAGGPSVTAQASRTTRNMRRTFSGVGPRIGLTASLPIIKPVTLDGSVGVAVLFGQAKSWSTQNFYSGSSIASLSLDGTSHSSEDHGRGIVSLSFNVGPTFHLSQNVAISASYKYEAFYNALPANFDSTTQASKNVIIQGPEVRLKLSF